MTLVPNARYTAVKRGISAVFQRESMRAAPYYPTLCTVVQSQGADEAYAMLGKAPGMQEWIGGREYGQISSAEMTLKNKLFESSLKFERQDVDDDRLGFLSEAVGDLAEEAACHPDELLFDLSKAGQTTLCWDGQFFFDTDHLWNESGTQSNIVNYTVSSTSDITPAEIKGAYHEALERMASFKRDNGKPWLKPTIRTLDSMRLNVPIALWTNSHKAFEQNVVAESNAGVTNFTMGASPTIDCIPWLGSDYTGGSDVKMDVYFTGGRMKPYLFQMRQPLTTQTQGADSIKHKDIFHLTEARYNVGYLAWFYAIRVIFAT